MSKPHHRFDFVELLAFLASIAVLFATASMTARADSSTTNLQVSARVMPNCRVNATDLTFGTYQPSATQPLAKDGKITVHCTKGTPFSVALDAGSNASSPGNFTDRVMSDNTSPAHLLKYQIYTTGTHDMVWGDGTGGTGTVSGTGAGPANIIQQTIHGQIPAGQDVPAGSYTDSLVTVTVNY